ncbi:MAG TPA: PA2779 family protein [Methylibium sp.]
MKTTRRLLTGFVAVCISYAGALQSAQAALVGTEDVAAAQGVVSADMQAEQARSHVNAILDRSDVISGLAARGVDVADARARVAALSDMEVMHLAKTLDEAPAGADDVLGTILFIFILLLITDILGFTKIFPFTRSIR